MLYKNHPKNPANQPFQHPSKKQKEDKAKREGLSLGELVRAKVEESAGKGEKK